MQSSVSVVPVVLYLPLLIVAAQFVLTRIGVILDKIFSAGFVIEYFSHWHSSFNSSAGMLVTSPTSG